MSPERRKRASGHAPRSGSATGRSGGIAQWLLVQLRDARFKLGSHGGFERDPYAEAIVVGRDPDRRERISEQSGGDASEPLSPASAVQPAGRRPATGERGCTTGERRRR